MNICTPYLSAVRTPGLQACLVKNQALEQGRDAGITAEPVPGDHALQVNFVASKDCLQIGADWSTVLFKNFTPVSPTSPNGSNLSE